MSKRGLIVAGNIVVAILLLSLLYPTVSATTSMSEQDGTWPPSHEPVAFLPRVNVVHVTDGNTDNGTIS